MQSKGLQLEKEIVQALRNQIPVQDLPRVRLRDVKVKPKDGFDVEFQLESGQRSVLVYGEIKPAVSPKLLEQLAPWIRRMRSLRPDAAFVLISPFLAPRRKPIASRTASTSSTWRAMFPSTSRRIYTSAPRHAK